MNSKMKVKILPLFGLLGGFLSAAIGGFDYLIQSLLIGMAIDYITGLCVAGIFHKSRKSANGSLDSKECFRGLCKKFVIIGLVVIGHRIDGILGIKLVRDGMAISFFLNECISIVENLGIMGVPLPKIVTKAIDLLRTKAGEDEKE